MRTNRGKSVDAPRTHEGGPAVRNRGSIDELRRTVCACLLWEDNFYESGADVADRIAKLVAECDADEVGILADEARNKQNMRHAPLLLCAALAKDGRLKAHMLAPVLRRADEPGEFISLFFKDGRRHVPHTIRGGIEYALRKFDAYQLAKYNRKTDAVRLRDVFRLVHPRPENAEQSSLWKSVLDGTIESPDTWEVALSGGADKREAFTRLLNGGKLGGMAVLRNLRNMVEAQVDEALIRSSIESMNVRRMLPFRFIAAARYAPRFERELDSAMMRSIQGMEKIPGRTAVLVDHSGSMNDKLSEKSEITRFDGACGLAMIAAGVFEECLTFAFSGDCAEVPPRQGFALRDAIAVSMPFSSTYLWRAVEQVRKRGPFDRVLVITDEQAHDSPTGPMLADRAYMLNVSPYQHGIAFGPWVTISGFSESFVGFIAEYERLGDR